MASRVTFGMIVLNGEPFTRYNLRALYPFAHQIIVVEGACEGASSQATPDGHSIDGTLEVLRQFQEEEDPEGKVTIVTAEDEGYPNAFWPGEKDEMSQAYAKRATGNLLWQVDSDEFYQPEHMATVLRYLEDNPLIDAVTFKQITFWGDLETRVDGFSFRCGNDICRRLWRWGPGHRYLTHRPPTVLDAEGRDLNEGKVLSGADLARRGVLLYHYCLLFPQQVKNKARYYDSATWYQEQGMTAWSQQSAEAMVKSFRVHNVTEHVSWLEQFPDTHPPQAQALWADVLAGRTDASVRRIDNVHKIMRSPAYRMKRAWLRASVPARQLGIGIRKKIGSRLKAALPEKVRRWLRGHHQRLTKRPPVGWVRFGSLRRLKPVSNSFGLDRGLPIDRYYVERFLAAHATDIHGHVMEIADNTYTKRFGGGGVTVSDVLHVTAGNAAATIVADLTCADQIPSATFDCIICTQTLQFIYGAGAALRTLNRILKPGGVLLATVPGISPISRYDMERWGEWWRFTTLSLTRLLEETFPTGQISVTAHGNVLAATAFLHGIAAEELRPSELDYHDPNYELCITVRAQKGR